MTDKCKHCEGEYITPTEAFEQFGVTVSEYKPSLWERLMGWLRRWLTVG